MPATVLSARERRAGRAQARWNEPGTAFRRLQPKGRFEGRLLRQLLLLWVLTRFRRFSGMDSAASEARALRGPQPARQSGRQKQPDAAVAERRELQHHLLVSRSTDRTLLLAAFCRPKRDGSNHLRSRCSSSSTGTRRAHGSPTRRPCCSRTSRSRLPTACSGPTGRRSRKPRRCSRTRSNHEIDLCNLYGFNGKHTDILRAWHGGELKSQFLKSGPDGKEEQWPMFHCNRNGKKLPLRGTAAAHPPRNIPSNARSARAAVRDGDGTRKCDTGLREHDERALPARAQSHHAGASEGISRAGMTTVCSRPRGTSLSISC